MFVSSKDTAPLIMSLHTWSGDYQQFDPLASLSLKAGWNYIHPDFRGPNNSTDSCLSDKVISDIDDSIFYVIKNGNVDKDNIFIVGTSKRSWTLV
ncbi:alpha/beta hydrolase family protein [Pseudoalteromonas arctica]|uniref:alpha/beta hydrolase family protein n=1 Tax=Pseudoalteromonas arctica TaxID=394751 RepID=UPI00026D10EC|nr:hypothetical protein [Pseudoalteromonas arctica]